MPLLRKAAATERQKARERFRRARLAERDYVRHLASVGRQVAAIIKGFGPQGAVADFATLNKSLADYAQLLEPWAIAVTQRMHAEAGRRDMVSWRSLSRSMGVALERELSSAPTGLIMRSLMADQVGLIKSIPLEAAKRVHELTIEAIVSGTRAEKTAREILATGNVTAARAMLIARTETSRTAGALTQARAEWIGSPGYFWRGVADGDERAEHLKLNGTFHEWSDPPIAGFGRGGVPMRYHPGCGPNCRCWPEPVLPDPQ